MKKILHLLSLLSIIISYHSSIASKTQFKLTRGNVASAGSHLVRAFIKKEDKQADGSMFL